MFDLSLALQAITTESSTTTLVTWTTPWFLEVVLPWAAPTLSLITALIAWRIAYLQQTLGARLKRDYYKYELFHRYRTQAYRNLNSSLMDAVDLVKGMAAIPADACLTEECTDKHYKTYLKLFGTFNTDSTYINDTELLNLIKVIIKAIEHVMTLHDPRIVILPENELPNAPQSPEEIPAWINSFILPRRTEAAKLLKKYFDFNDTD